MTLSSALVNLHGRISVGVCDAQEWNGTSQFIVCNDNITQICHGVGKVREFV